MKRLFFVFTLSTSFSVMADVYLQSGQSQFIRGDVAHCNVNAPTERRFSCTYSACLRSDSNMNTSVHNCEFFENYKTYSVNIWAYEGSEAVRSVRDQLSGNSDVVDYKVNSIDCN